MKITVKACKLELTPAIVEYVNKKIGSLEKFVQQFEKRCECKVQVEIARSTKHHRQGLVFYAEANLLLNGKVIRAEEYNEDMRAAIDKVKDKLKIEIGKFKERKLERDKSK